jgi:hypothetical protein
MEEALSEAAKLADHATTPLGSASPPDGIFVLRCAGGLLCRVSGVPFPLKGRLLART